MDNKQTTPQKQLVPPSKEEMDLLTKELDVLLKKLGFVMQPTLKVGSSGIVPEIRVFKVVAPKPATEPSNILTPQETETPAKPKTADEKAVN